GRHLVIRLFVDLRGAGLKDLIRSLEEASRVDEFASSGSAVGISGVFPGSTSVVVACIDSGGGGGGGGRKGNLPALRWWRFCCQWSFRHRGCPVFALPQVAEAGGDPERCCQLSACLSAGSAASRRSRSLPSSTKASRGCAASRPGRMKIQLERSLLNCTRGCLNIRVDAPGTNGFALVDWQLGLVAVPVRFCPKSAVLDLILMQCQRCWMYADEAELNPVVDGNRFLDAQATCQLLLLHLDQRLLTPRCAFGQLPAGWHFAAFPGALLETRLTLVQNESEAAAAAATPDQTVYEDIDRPQAPKRPRIGRLRLSLAAPSRVGRSPISPVQRRFCSTDASDIDDKIDEGDEMGLLRMAAVLRQLQTLRAFLADPAARLETCRRQLYLYRPRSISSHKNTQKALLRELPQDKLELLQPVTPPEIVRVLRALSAPPGLSAYRRCRVESSRLLRRWTPEGGASCWCFHRRGRNSVRNAQSEGQEPVHPVLMDGLLLAGRRFRLLSASGSQLRSQRCLFVDREEIRRQFAAMRHSLVGSRAKLQFVPKYLASFWLPWQGFWLLCRVSDCYAEFLVAMQFFWLPCRVSGCYAEFWFAMSEFLDCYSAMAEFLIFMPSCGKISSRLAAEMADRLGYSVSATPSAYQFRYAGAKGVLVVVDPDEDPEFLEAGSGDNIDVLFGRPMREVRGEQARTPSCAWCRPARALPVRLNRRAITLLESLGRRLDQASTPTATREWPWHRIAFAGRAARAGCTSCGGTRWPGVKKALTRRDSLANRRWQEYIEPHQVASVRPASTWPPSRTWRSLLRLAFQFRVQDLRSRTALPVDDGCRVMGAADPTGVVGRGRDSQRRRRRHPHGGGSRAGLPQPLPAPGDLRLARAVSVREKPQLRQWVKQCWCSYAAGPDCRASLAADCSGGDLRRRPVQRHLGPRARAATEEALHPHPALNYAELAANTAKPSPRIRTCQPPGLVAEFYLANLENTFLGRVAHMHLALCDLLQDGACDPLARKLAESQSVAVDFPKTALCRKVV
uniref:RNA-dependent RNA polymerase n=1 Tax=Macrostomum lignano TaxID=282301 RepID=A0A1I8JQW4_9PLAT